MLVAQNETLVYSKGNITANYATDTSLNRNVTEYEQTNLVPVLTVNVL